MLDQSIIEHLRAEEAELISKLEAIRSVLIVYGADVKTGASFSAPHIAKQASALLEGNTARVRAPLDRFSAYGANVIRTAMRCIEEHPIVPVPTRLLVDLIQERGVEIRGEDKVNALSALLARCLEVKSNGRRGWTIEHDEEESGEDGPNENEASHGQAGDASDARAKGAANPF